MNALTLEMLEKFIADSGYFIRERIPHLMAVLRDATHPFARLDTKAAYRGGTVLSRDEKRSLGLNCSATIRMVAGDNQDG